MEGEENGTRDDVSILVFLDSLLRHQEGDIIDGGVLVFQSLFFWIHS